MMFTLIRSNSLKQQHFLVFIRDTSSGAYRLYNDFSSGVGRSSTEKEPSGTMINRTPPRITVGSRWRGFSNPHRALCAVLALLQLFLPSLVVALPSDGNVVGGHATIQQVNPHQLDIQQTTDKAILNWKSFSIAGNESVHFMQPSVSSIALNRVIGTDPSVILGHLQSNGRIFLLNPNGILFGAGAQIDVGGLLATTLQIRNDDFMAGRYLFAQDPLKGLHTVINRGTIHVSDHGFVFLAAPGVSNEGLIVATLGQVVLGSGQTLTIDLMGDGLINYALSGKVLDQVMGMMASPSAQQSATLARSKPMAAMSFCRPKPPARFSRPSSTRAASSEPAAWRAMEEWYSSSAETRPLSQRLQPGRCVRQAKSVGRSSIPAQSMCLPLKQEELPVPFRWSGSESDSSVRW